MATGTNTIRDATDPSPDDCGVIRPSFVLCIAVLWLCIVGAGFVELWQFVNTPGRPGNPPATWPQASALEHDRCRPTLVVVVDPRCSCTLAVLRELGMLVARCRGRIAVRVLATGPAASIGFPNAFVTVAKMPSVRIVTDRSGREAGHFGVATSGTALLFSVDGRRMFHGGITSGRGHAGDNAGRDAIVQLVTGDASAACSAPVYGCELCPRADRPDGEENW